MLILETQTDLRPAMLFAERMRQSLHTPLRDQAGLGAGFEEAVHVYAGAVRRRFASAMNGDGTWAPLAESTKRRKKRYGMADRILYLTGDLYTSLVPGEAGSIFEVLSDRIRYGTSVPYAKYHQVGGGRLPQRTILVEPTEDILARCVAPIVSGWRKAIEAHVSSA